MDRDKALAVIAARLSAFAGLDPPAWVLEARARERAARTDVDLADYAALVTEDAVELRALAEAIRIGETRFFRHAAHVQALKRTVIPARLAACAGRPFRAWSAGCASGEEAWTLAILLAEVTSSPFELLATDLSDGALVIARAGRYPAAALEDVPPAVRQRWFTVEGKSAVVTEPLRARVRFERRNLLDSPYPRGFDLILCRNVLIYFDDARRDEVIDRLAESLLPGGYLFLGYSETLRSHDTLFEALREEAGVIYRRRSPDAPPPRAPLPVPPPAAAPPPSRTYRAGPPRKIPTLLGNPPPPRTPAVRLEGSYEGDGADRLTGELKPILDGAARSIDLDGATFLGDEAARILARVAESCTGRVALRASRSAVRRWIERHRLDARFTVEGAAADE